MVNFDPARYFNKTTSGLSLVAIADNSSLMHFFIIQFCTLLNSFFEEVKISKEASIMTPEFSLLMTANIYKYTSLQILKRSDEVNI